MHNISFVGKIHGINFHFISFYNNYQPILRSGCYFFFVVFTSHKIRLNISRNFLFETLYLLGMLNREKNRKKSQSKIEVEKYLNHKFM